MGFDWYVSFGAGINYGTGLPWITMTTPIPPEHRRWLGGRGSSWYDVLFVTLNFTEGESCPISSLDLDNFPEWEDIEGQVEELETEEEYKSFKAAFTYFSKLDSLYLNISY